MITYLGSPVQLCCQEGGTCKQISLACVGSTHSLWTTLGLPHSRAALAFVYSIGVKARPALQFLARVSETALLASAHTATTLLQVIVMQDKEADDLEEQWFQQS